MQATCTNHWVHLMISFQANDMTCGHGVSSLFEALKAAGTLAEVRFDQAAHRVNIDRAMPMLPN